MSLVFPIKRINFLYKCQYKDRFIKKSNLVKFKPLSRKRCFSFRYKFWISRKFFEVSKQLNLNPIFVDNLDLTLNLSRFSVIHFRQIRTIDFQCTNAIAIVTQSSRASAQTHAIYLGFTKCPSWASNSADVSSGAHIEQLFLFWFSSDKKKFVIGANSTILSKLKIRGDIITWAGSVVTKDVPANVTVFDVPAKLVG